MSGREGWEKGRRHEALALELLKEAPVPSWMVSVRPGTIEEDHLGIVLVINADIGKIPLQIKSSKGQVKKFKRKHKEISAVVIDELEPRILLKARIMQILYHEVKKQNKLIEIAMAL